MTLKKCVVVQRLAGGHFSVKFSACTALLFDLPTIFQTWLVVWSWKKDLIGNSDVLYCDACSEQSLCTVNMYSLYIWQTKIPYLSSCLRPRVVFSLILERKRKILKWMTIDTSVFIRVLFFENLRSVGKIYCTVDFCFGQLKLLYLRRVKLLCSSPSYLTVASEAWIRKCKETFGANLDTSNIL